MPPLAWCERWIKHHVTNDHNMWNYLFMIIYLKDKHAKGEPFTAQEDYVWVQSKKNFSALMPNGDALCIQDEEDGDNDSDSDSDSD